MLWSVLSKYCFSPLINKKNIRLKKLVYLCYFYGSKIKFHATCTIKFMLYFSSAYSVVPCSYFFCLLLFTSLSLCTSNIIKHYSSFTEHMVCWIFEDYIFISLYIELYNYMTFRLSSF